MKKSENPSQKLNKLLKTGLLYANNNSIKKLSKSQDNTQQIIQVMWSKRQKLYLQTMSNKSIHINRHKKVKKFVNDLIGENIKENFFSSILNINKRKKRAKRLRKKKILSTTKMKLAKEL